MERCTTTSGRHSLKFGGDFRNLRFNEGQNSQPSGVFNFTRVYTQGPTATQASTNAGFGLASFLLGDVTSGTIIRNNRLSTQGIYWALYAQDDWRVNDRLSLNLGLRYDVSIGDREKYDKLAWFDPSAASPIAGPAGLPSLKGAIDWVGQGNDINQQSTQWNNVGPRFGFAFKAHPTTVMRGGYGMFFYPRIIAGTNGGAIEAVQQTTMNATLNNGLTPADKLSNPFPNGTCLPRMTAIRSRIWASRLRFRRTTALRTGIANCGAWVFSRTWGSGFVLDIHYWANKGTHLINSYNINQLPDQYLSLGTALNQQVTNPFYGVIATGTLARPTISRQQSLLPFPQYLGISDVYAPYSGSNYQRFDRADRQACFEQLYVAGKLHVVQGAR